MNWDFWKDRNAMSRLTQSIRFYRQELSWSRKQRTQNIQDYVGCNYMQGGSKHKRPINMQEVMVSINMQNLAGNVPNVMYTTASLRDAPRIKTTELVHNDLYGQIDFEDTMLACVLDAHWGLGIAKIGLAPFFDADNSQVYSQPFVERVSEDDWFHDTQAPTFAHCTMMGNLYRAPIETLKADPAFDPDEVAQLKPQPDRMYDEMGAKRAKSVSGGQGFDNVGIVDMADLADVWIPAAQVLLTIRYDGSAGAWPIRAVQWKGPTHGPYHILRYGRVPDQIMPFAPIQVGKDLGDSVDALARKGIRQAERAKTVYGAQARQTGDADRQIKADDGDVIKLDGPGAVQAMNFPGADPSTIALMIQLKQMYSYRMGNLDGIGGLSPQSDTLGQDELLAGANSKHLQFMQKQTLRFAQKISRDFGDYLWKDPDRTFKVYQQLFNGVTIERELAPADREGKMPASIDVDVYSAESRTPQSKMRALQTINAMLAPYAALAAQQGVVPDIPSQLRMIAKLLNFDEIEDMYQMVPEIQAQSAATEMPHVATKSPVTTRNEVRTNRPGAISAQQDGAMAAALLGQNRQGAERATVLRPTG